jgi:hypothetical protein
MSLRAVACACLLAASLSGPAGAAHRCPVTRPNHVVPSDAGFGPQGFNYGNARLRVALSWPNGTLAAGVLPNGGSRATIGSDGSISAKVGWWRDARGIPFARLRITGKRLDRPAPPLRAHVPEGYGAFGFQPTGLVFPTVGCWRVVGRDGPARLAFVVRVTKLR